MKSCGLAATAAVLILASSPLAAQGRGTGRGARVLPVTPRTPYGLCRIWIDGLPSERQPAVTGCAYAYSNAPRNGRVIYGGERGELFGRSDPYYYDRDVREHGYPDSYSRDSYSRDSYSRDSYSRDSYTYGSDTYDSYAYDSRYRRDADDRDRSRWSYRTNDRYDSYWHARRQRNTGDMIGAGQRHNRSNYRNNGKAHHRGNNGSHGRGNGRWR